MAEVLLQAGANINSKQNNMTLLMKFCNVESEMTDIQKALNLDVIKVSQSQNLILIQFLIENGADKQAMTPDGKTAFDLAQTHPNKDAVLQTLNTTKQLVYCTYLACPIEYIIIHMRS